jgi:hypothetical protein
LRKRPGKRMTFWRIHPYQANTQPFTKFLLLPCGPARLRKAADQWESLMADLICKVHSPARATLRTHRDSDAVLTAGELKVR